MVEKRIKVWIQHCTDRANLLLQWLDPDTGRRKSRSAGTANEREAEWARGDLEASLNAGRVPHLRDAELPSLADIPPEPGSIVYFIRQAPRGPIKIGTTKGDALRRLGTLQTACAASLFLMGTMPGGTAMEKHLHDSFRALRIRGEWFSPSPALLRFIRENVDFYQASERD